MYNNFNKNHIRPYESQMFEQLPNSRFSEIESKKIPKHKKINLKDLQKKACTSLNEVECFLCNFSSLKKYLKIYNLLKK